jgi:hypothetical protein
VLTVGPLAGAGIRIAHSATAIARGIAMILFWRSGRWRTAEV